MPQFEVLAEGLKFPESPIWSARDGRLYLVEWYGDSLLALQEGRLKTLFQTEPGGGPSGLCQDALGNLWATLYSSCKVVCYSPQGDLLLSIRDFQGAPFRGVCDITADQRGGVYFTDSGDFEEDWRSGRPAGAVYYFSQQEGLVQVDRDLCFPNGIGLSPDDRTLYVNEHRRNRTLAYRLWEGGKVFQKSVLHTFDTHSLVPPETAFELGPDGLCVTDAGDLWVAHYCGGKLVHLGPFGEWLSELLLPRGRMPTSVAFCPLDGSLYVTEAEYGLLYRVSPIP